MLLAGAMLAAPGTAWAQGTIGEFRILVVAGPALRPGGAQAPADFPPPAGRAMAGISGSLSFIYRELSAGPEVMFFHGSDRRMYALGGVARLTVSTGRVHPYLLLGAGSYAWDRRMIQPFDSASGPRWTSDKTYLTGSAGGGLVIGDPSLSFVLEIRAHKSLGLDEFFGSRDLLSISGGGRVSW